MASDTSKFLKGITTGYAYMFFSLFVSLWLVPFVLRYLTKSEYGIFAVATDLLGWLSIANLGITAVFNSKGAQLLGSKSGDELNEMASTTFFTQLFSALIIIIIGAFIVVNPDSVFGSSSGVGDLKIVVALLSLSYLIQYIAEPLNAVLVADKQIHVDNYLKFGLLAFKTIITVVLLINGFKLMSLAISSLSATIIISVISWARLKKSLPDVKLKWKYWRVSCLRFLVRNGFWFTIGGIAGILIFRIDSFLIGKFISLFTVASFVITIKLYQIANTFHQQFFNTSRPYFAQMYGKNEMSKLKKMYNLAFQTSFASAFAMGIGVFIINKWFIGWWVGSEFYLGDTISMLMAINFILQASVLPNRILLAMTFFKIEIHNLTRVAEGIAKFLISYFLISMYGIEALLIAGIISSIVFSNTILNLLASTFFKESFWIKIIPFMFISIIPLIIIFFEGYIQILLLFVLTVSILYFMVIKYLDEEDLVFVKEIILKFRKK